MMVLARLFTPDIFGTVAAVAVFFAFFRLISEASLAPAVVNLRDMTAVSRDGIFSLTLCFGITLASLFQLFGPLLLRFYSIPRLNEVVSYAAVAIMFQIFSTLPNALLQRDRAFSLIARTGIMSEVISTTAVIALARCVDPLHALASKSAFSAATMFVLAWRYAQFTEFGRPYFGRNFSAIKLLLKFSSYQLAFNFVNYFSRNLDTILVGKHMGPSVLAGYDKAYKLMQYPLLVLSFALTPAIQPVMREFGSDGLVVSNVYSRFCLNLSLPALVVALGIFLFPAELVQMVFGSQWGSVAPIVQILALSLPVQVVMATSGSFFQAMNSPHFLFLSGLLSAFVMVFAIVAGVTAGDVELLCWYLVFALHINYVQVALILYILVFDVPLTPHFPKMSLAFWPSFLTSCILFLRS